MLSVLIITKNEEIHLGRLIKNVKDLADEIIILDSFSSDQTIEIAKREKLAKEALATRSNKTLPKGFGQEPPSGGPHAHDEKHDEANAPERHDEQ